jgi:hypothetical protein
VFDIFAGCAIPRTDAGTRRDVPFQYGAIMTMLKLPPSLQQAVTVPLIFGAIAGADRYLRIGNMPTAGSW